jgi:exonuclease III
VKIATFNVDGVNGRLLFSTPSRPSPPSGDCRPSAFARNAGIGIGIDHLLLNNAAKRLDAAGVDTWLRTREKANTHGPAWVELGLGASRVAQACGLEITSPTQ